MNLANSLWSPNRRTPGGSLRASRADDWSRRTAPNGYRGLDIEFKRHRQGRAGKIFYFFRFADRAPVLGTPAAKEHQYTANGCQIGMFLGRKVVGNPKNSGCVRRHAADYADCMDRSGGWSSLHLGCHARDDTAPRKRRTGPDEILTPFGFTRGLAPGPCVAAPSQCVPGTSSAGLTDEFWAVDSGSWAAPGAACISAESPGRRRESPPSGGGCGR